VLILLGMTLAVLAGVVGMALDLGRLYVVRTEAQAFADLAALKAAHELDGKRGAIARARRAVESSPMRWDFGTRPFTGSLIEFSADQSAWASKPVTLAAVRYVRVTADLDQVELYFLPAVMGPKKARVRAQAVAASEDGQVRLIR